MNEITELKDSIGKLRNRLWARGENAYCDMIQISRQDECLGWEIKVEKNEFGRKELDAHCGSYEKLGRHRAFVEACIELDEIIKTITEAHND